MSHLTFTYNGGKNPGQLRKVTVDPNDGGKITNTRIVGRDATRGNQFRCFDKSKIIEMLDI